MQKHIVLWRNGSAIALHAKGCRFKSYRDYQVLLAQLAERFLDMEEAVGSNPTGNTLQFIINYKHGIILLINVRHKRAV